jgi:hypothetical protein
VGSPDPGGSVLAWLKRLSEQAEDLRESQRQERIERTRERERLRGIKTGLRLPLLQAAGANPFSVGGDTNTLTGQQPQRPAEGYAWALRHIVVEGLTSGATPDKVNILRGGRIIWQLNGNNFGQTWGRGELWIRPGESLAYQSVGTFAATGTIIIHGAVDEFPAEMAAKAVD